MQLLRKASKQVLVPNLKCADSFWTRTKGLLGRKNLPESEALWIPRCNSVHTYFMKFPIDLVFVDRSLVVVKVCHAVQPGRLVLPVWRASGVIELPSGFVKRQTLVEGEELYVDHSLS